MPEPLPIFPAVRYDAVRRRVWIGTQRCHHGAVGALAATLAFVELIGHRRGVSGALAASGALLMAHDWKDRSCWFQRGPQNQY